MVQAKSVQGAPAVYRPLGAHIQRTGRKGGASSLSDNETDSDFPVFATSAELEKGSTFQIPTVDSTRNTRQGAKTGKQEVASRSVMAPSLKKETLKTEIPKSEKFDVENEVGQLARVYDSSRSLIRQGEYRQHSSARIAKQKRAGEVGRFGCATTIR